MTIRASLVIVLLALAFPRPVAAQDVDGKLIAIGVGAAATPHLIDAADKAGQAHLAWAERRRPVADWLSLGTIGGGMVLACADDWTRQCALRAAGRIGLTVAIAETTKHFVHRERPDKSDKKSFFSEHTAIACVSGFSSEHELVATALCGGTAYLRVAANRHWVSDVAVGAVAGLAISRIAR